MCTVAKEPKSLLKESGKEPDFAEFQDFAEQYFPAVFVVQQLSGMAEL